MTQAYDGVAGDGVVTHGRFDQVEDAFRAELETPLDARGPDSLYDLVGAMGLPAGSSAVDVGCGRGRQSVELARRFGFEVLGIDPWFRAGDAARAAGGLTSGSGSGSVRFGPGTAESIPVEDGMVDLIFSRESLMWTELPAAASEFARVLRPEGRGLAYLVLAGPRVTDDELRELAAPLEPRSVRPADILEALRAAGLRIDDQLDYRSEWGELAEQSDGTAGRRLLHAARLLRDPARYVERFGRDNYDIMLADCLWHVYRMIGKLRGYAVTFAKPA